MVTKVKLVLLVLVLGIFSCKKADERSCFKKAGAEKVVSITFEEDIDSLFLNDDLFYTLIPGNKTKIELVGGENLLTFIEVSAKNGKLTVLNNNKCGFLRSYKHEIHAKIYIDSVTYIEYRGSSELKSKDTLFSNELRLEIKDGAGDVNLTVKNGYTSAVITHGFGNYILKGQTLIAFLNCNSNSYCDARGFTATESIFAYSNTVGDMLINADSVPLKAVILQSGNIKYIGAPNSKELIREGNGNLIDLN